MTLLMGLMLLPGLLIGLTFHECAHAWSASLLGDDYPRRQGRVSLNPFRHLSLLGTLAIFFLPFGWARPVPVNLYNFRRPRRDFLLTSLAGPAANVLIVAACIGLMQLTRRSFLFGPGGEVFLELGHALLRLIVLINALLATLNLLPLPPLDGSKIWPVLIPGLTPGSVGKLSHVSILVLLVLLWTGAIRPVFEFALRTVDKVVPNSDSGRFDAALRKADRAYNRGNYDRAVEQYTAALAINPRSAETFIDRARARFGAGNWRGAVADVERALELAERRPGLDELRSECRLLRLRAKSMLAEDDGDYAAAEGHLTEALGLDPDSDDVLYERASVRIARENWAAALEDLNRAIELRKAEADYFDRRADVLEHLGQKAKASFDRTMAEQLRLKAEIGSSLPDPNAVLDKLGL
jgi:Zn-dependent protease